MKKILLTAMVMCIAIPALAAEITLVDNADSTGTISLVVGSGEVVRGLAIVVDADSQDIIGGGVTGTDPNFNVFMDAAFMDPGNYNVGQGGPVADPDAAGTIALPASRISLSMGKVDESGGQEGLPEGTYVVAIIDFGVDNTANVTITEDALRGGIVGDNLGASTMPPAAFPITNGVVTQYNLTVTVVGTGTEDTYGHGYDGDLDENTMINLVGSPAVGWHLVSILPDNNFPLVAETNITVTFEINTYTVTFVAGGNGTISGTLVQVGIEHGSDCTEVDPDGNTNYHFDNWTGDHIGDEDPLTITNVTATMNITANFAIDQYTLTYNTGGNGSIGGTTPQTVDHGSSGSPVTADADANYHFVDWSDASTDNPRTDTNVTANITVTANFEADLLDFGDAENFPYPTTLANNGARHVIGGPFLGPAGDEPDAELNGQPNAGATGDDDDGNDDEDGVTLVPLKVGVAVPVNFEVNGGGGDVSAWIDFNADGDWQDAGEEILSGAAYGDGAQSVMVTAPAGSAIGLTYVRFRITTDGAVATTGLASDGEVEDHEVLITECMIAPGDGGSTEEYNNWVGAGKNWTKPDCWCYQRQCRGDTDGNKAGFFWVDVVDLNVFISAYAKGDPKMDQTKICADLNHKKAGFFRCAVDDLNTFIAYYAKGPVKVPACPLDWDGDVDGNPNYNFWLTP